MTTSADAVPDQSVLMIFIQPFSEADVLYCSPRRRSHFSHSNKHTPTRLTGAVYRARQASQRAFDSSKSSSPLSPALITEPQPQPLCLSKETDYCWYLRTPRRKMGTQRQESLSDIAFLAFDQIQLHSIHRRLQVNTNKIFSEASFPESFPKLCLRSRAGYPRTLRLKINGGLLWAQPWAIWRVRHGAFLLSRFSPGTDVNATYTFLGTSWDSTVKSLSSPKVLLYVGARRDKAIML